MSRTIPVDRRRGGGEKAAILGLLKRILKFLMSWGTPRVGNVASLWLFFRSSTLKHSRVLLYFDRRVLTVKTGKHPKQEYLRKCPCKNYSTVSFYSISLTLNTNYQSLKNKTQPSTLGDNLPFPPFCCRQPGGELDPRPLHQKEAVPLH